MAVLFVRLAPIDHVLEAIEGRGRVVSCTPDRTIAVLPSAGAALAAAWRLQDLSSCAVGVEVGEPAEEVDGELFGLCVWVAARLAGVAKTGQVVFSDLVREVAGLTATEYESLGQIDLKGIPHPVAACALTGYPALPISDATTTMLAIDQVGSTAQLAALGDVRAGRVHVALLDIVRGAAEETGACELEYTGDGLLFAFDSAAAATRAATAMQAGATRRALRLTDDESVRLRIGLAIHDDPDETRTAAINACESAVAGQVLLTRAFAEVAAPTGVDVRPSNLGNLIELVWTVDPLVVPLPAAVEGGLPVLGREHELAILQGRWESARAGRRAAVVVTGPGGVGTSSLLLEFARSVSSDHATVVLFASAVGAPELTALGAALIPYVATTPRAELREQLGELASTLSPVIPTLGQRLGSGELFSGASNVVIGQALEVALARISADQPVLLVIDDLHEASEDLLRALRSIAMGTTAAKLMLLTGARASEFGETAVIRALGVDPRRSGSGFEELVLAGLTSDTVVTLLTRTLGSAPDAAMARSVIGETEGIPALVLSYASSLAGRRATRRIDTAAQQAIATRASLGQLREDIVTDLRLVHRDTHTVEQPRSALIDPEGTPPAVVGCPYKGLEVFGSEDAEFFAGRDDLVAHLAVRLITTRLVAVVGASGSGKSSLVRAGLLPTLAQDLSSAQPWEPVVLVPGQQPRRALATALAPARNGAGARRLVVIDQFEEIFSPAVVDADREGFVGDVLTLAGPEHADTWVVIVLRGDFYTSCAAHPALAAWIADSQVLVGAMSEPELREAIERPAIRAGLVLEPGLVDAIVYDVSGEDGGLPLVSTALLETWNRRRGRTLTLRGYADAGGVRGAVARLAEELYLSLPAERQPLVQTVFMRLAEVGEHGQEMRRRASRSEFDTGDAATREVVAALVSGRLLTADENTVEVAHEALLREWPRLREWLTDAKDRRRDVQSLATAATAWQTAGRDPELLARGTRLAGAADLAADANTPLSDVERSYVAASVAHRDQEIVTVRRANRRLRRLLAAALAFFLVALAAGGVALAQRSDARHQATIAVGRGLAAQATALTDRQLDTSLLLATEGWQRYHSPDTEAGLLAAMNAAQHIERFVPQLGNHLSDAIANATTGKVLRQQSDGALDILNASTWAVDGASLERRDKGLTTAAFSPDGRLAAAVDGAGVTVFDVATRHKLAGPFGDPSTVDLHFFPDDRTAVATADGSAISYDVTTGKPRTIFTTNNQSLSDATVSHDGKTVAIIESPNVVLANAHTGKVLRTIPVPTVQAEQLEFGATDKTLLLGALDTHSALLDVASGTLIGGTLDITGSRTAAIGFSPDGSRLWISSDDGSTRVWDTAGPTLVATLTGLDGASQPSCLDPACRRILAVSSLGGQNVVYDLDRQVASGTTATAASGQNFAGLVVPLSNGGYLTAGSDETARQFSNTLAPVGKPVDLGFPAFRGAGSMLPDGVTVVVGGETAQANSHAVAALVDTTHNRVVRTISIPALPYLSFAVVDPTGKQLLVGGGGKITILDVATGRLDSNVVTADALTTITGGAWSADGARVFTGGQEGVLKVWKVGRTLTLVKAIPVAQTDADISDVERVGNTLLTSAEDGSARLIDATTFKVRQTFTAGGTQLEAVGYEPATNRVYAVNRDGAMRVWDATTGRAIGPALDGHGSLSWSLATVGKDEVVTVGGTTLIRWDLNPAEMAATSCRLAGRNLTRAEWTLYLPGQTYHRTCAQWPAG